MKILCFVVALFAYAVCPVYAETIVPEIKVDAGFFNTQGKGIVAYTDNDGNLRIISGGNSGATLFDADLNVLQNNVLGLPSDAIDAAILGDNTFSLRPGGSIEVRSIHNQIVDTLSVWNCSALGAADGYLYGYKEDTMRRYTSNGNLQETISFDTPMDFNDYFGGGCAFIIDGHVCHMLVNAEKAHLYGDDGHLITQYNLSYPTLDITYIGNNRFALNGEYQLSGYVMISATINIPSVDADLDGLTYWVEEEFGTNPDRADTDNDTMPDGDEIFAGTDPTDAESYLFVSQLSMFSEYQQIDIPVICWTSEPGKTYTVWVQSDSIGEYFVVLDNNVISRGSETIYPDQGGGPNEVPHPRDDDNLRMYKVSVNPE